MDTANHLGVTQIPNHPRYLIDQTGVVYRLPPVKSIRIGKREPRPLKQYEDKDGYYFVSLFTEKRYYKKFIHVLLLEVFVGPRPSSRHVSRHLDGNPKNNAIHNLVWGTQSDNMQDSIRHGTFVRGEKNGMSKVSDVDAKTICTEYESTAVSQRQLARRYGVSQAAIWYIVHNRVTA